MPLMFNPPPTWPPAPPGWSPPPGWQPDPRWGPSPPGWQLWKRANPDAFLRSLSVAGIFFGSIFALVVTRLEVERAGEGAGYAMGQALIAGMVAGIFPYRSRNRWGWGLHIVTTLGVCLLLIFLRLSAARRGG